MRDGISRRQALLSYCQVIQNQNDKKFRNVEYIFRISGEGELEGAAGRIGGNTNYLSREGEKHFNEGFPKKAGGDEVGAVLGGRERKLKSYSRDNECDTMTRRRKRVTFYVKPKRSKRRKKVSFLARR